MITFICDPALGELSKELRKHLRDGTIKYSDALEQMKKAIKIAIKHKSTIIRDGGDN
jgi:hypothetical protein